MRVFFFVVLFAFCLSSRAQEISLPDTLQTTQSKLNYLASEIFRTQFSDPDHILAKALAYDSISKLDPTKENRAEALGYLGMGHYVTENYDKAIQYYLESAREWEALNNSDQLVVIYNRLAAAFIIRDDFPKTEEYFLKAKDVATQSRDSLWVANINNNLSILYANQKLYDKAISVNLDALNYFLGKNDSVHIAISYMNLANAELYKGTFNEALEDYQNSMKFIKQNQIPLLYAVANTGIGIGLTETKKYDEALPFLENGLAIAKQINHTEQIMESYNALANYYSLTENFKDAYALTLESQKLKDSLLTATQDQNMADALTKYESEKKDAQLKVLSLETEQAQQERRLYSYMAVAGLLITGLIGFFYFKNHRKNQLLAQQKKLLEAAVDEKNVLLKETHHRVKNSFQIVSSLLYLQSENMEDTHAQKALKEAQNRVHSMVLIHQKLYSKDQLVGIDTQEYLSDLVRDILESHLNSVNEIECQLTIEPIVLSIETITPLGLIINELVTNVVKHAFSDNAPYKKLQLTLKRTGDHLELKVIDNGKGMPDEIGEHSFGIQLIRSLSKKLKGTLELNPNTPSGTIALVNCQRFQEL